MSKFNLIALAVAATLAAPSAFAITVVPTATQTRVAHVDVEDDATVVSVGAIPVGIADTDLIIGRTVGFSVRIDLQGGAEFAAAPATVPVGSALLAGVSVGIFASHEEAIQKSVHLSTRVTPIPEVAEAYEKHFENYRKVHDVLAEIYHTY